ncbi:MAG TPA: tetratricopeptide repeat protein [Bryobacteraceae bacterium]|jgi:DNA-binding winged helix-turn-helix (wHTH) protein/Flp pilus assembly protein TadD|nr:tetratricopeptide repeat protein [Bryobacteraceae bacterium]
MEQITFGPFRLDTTTTTLLRDGQELELRPQAFHALRALIHNRGRYVGYAQMINQAWDGNLVSKHTVAVTIGEVKKILGEFGLWISYRPKLGYRLEVPHSDDLVKQGWHFWSRRTREGFEKALDCFQQGALENPSDFRAFEGLSLCYLMLGTYGMRMPREMYSGFLQAHKRAVELCGLTPERRADRAHGLHVFEHRFEEAEVELLQAQRESPESPEVYVRLTMLYVTQNRLDEALNILLAARITHSLWPTVPANEILIRVCRREYDAAVACGKKALDLHPYLYLGRLFYGEALEHSGNIAEALEQYRLTIIMSPDLGWLRAFEARCLAKHGRRKDAQKILGELNQIRKTQYIDAYYMAILLDALGDRDQAFQELERAYHEKSVALFMLDVDPKLDDLRQDVRFAVLREKVFADKNVGPRAVSA